MHRDLGPFLRELERNPAADPARTPGNQRMLGHPCLLLNQRNWPQKRLTPDHPRQISSCSRSAPPPPSAPPSSPLPVPSSRRPRPAPPSPEIPSPPAPCPRPAARSPPALPL